MENMSHKLNWQCR